MSRRIDSDELAGWFLIGLYLAGFILAWLLVALAARIVWTVWT